MSKQMGRPKKEIDKQTFEKLCGIQCTEEEIAAWFSCSVDTIERWCKRTYKRTFAEVFREKREAGKVSLRRMQWQLAAKSAPLSIFLGKNYLGQRDERSVDLSGQVAVNPFGELTVEELRRLAQDDE